MTYKLNKKCSNQILKKIADKSQKKNLPYHDLVKSGKVKENHVVKYDGYYGLRLSGVCWIFSQEAGIQYPLLNMGKCKVLLCIDIYKCTALTLFTLEFIAGEKASLYIFRRIL